MNLSPMLNNQTLNQTPLFEIASFARKLFIKLYIVDLNVSGIARLGGDSFKRFDVVMKEFKGFAAIWRNVFLVE